MYYLKRFIVCSLSIILLYSINTTKANASECKYGSPTFIWDSDFKSVIAEFICENNPSHVMTKQCIVEVDTRPATCTEQGLNTYIAKCTFDGKTYQNVYESTIMATGHKWNDFFSSDETKHWRECTRAGCTAKISEEEHSFETIVDVEGSCEKTGSQHEECKECGYAKAAIEIPLIAHTLEKVERKNATCNEVGYEAYWKCKRCQRLFSDEAGTVAINAPEAILLTGHNWKDGICTVCGEKQPETEETKQEVTQEVAQAEMHEVIQEANPEAAQEVTSEIKQAESAVTAITTTETPKIKTDTSSPKTGDGQEMCYSWIILLLSVAGFIGAIWKREK